MFRSGQVVVQNLQGMRDLIGVDLLAAFLKCFHGVDRLLSLEQLLMVNQRSLEDGSIAQTRNLRLVAFYLASTMYELGDALQGLCSARVVERISDRAVWEPVNQLRGQWRGDARFGKIRNALGFHLGERDDYRTGIDRLVDQPTAAESLFYVHDGEGRRHEGECRLAFDSLLAGLSIDESDMHYVLAATRQAHVQLPDQLIAVWADVCETAGIPIVTEPDSELSG